MLIKSLPVWTRYADAFMLPIMLYISGAPMEAPQETHRWNNKKIPRDELSWLDPELMAVAEADPDANPAFIFWVIPRFHLTRWGGWKQYAVLEMPKDVDWYVGWRTDRVCGISLLPITGRRVRCLVGDADTEFFAITEHGVQLPLTVRSKEGVIGRGDLFCGVPLR